MFQNSVILVWVFVAVAFAGEITFRDCGSVARTIQKVEVTNCNRTRCDVVKGQKYEVLVYFTSAIGAGGLTLDIDMTGRSSIVTTQLMKTENGGGCSGLDIGCPFPGGFNSVHNTTLVVAEGFFELPAVITHILSDNNNRKQICIEADVNVIAGDK